MGCDKVDRRHGPWEALASLTRHDKHWIIRGTAAKSTWHGCRGALLLQFFAFSFSVIVSATSSPPTPPPPLNGIANTRDAPTIDGPLLRPTPRSRLALCSLTTRASPSASDHLSTTTSPRPLPIVHNNHRPSIPPSRTPLLPLSPSLEPARGQDPRSGCALTRRKHGAHT